MNTKTLNSDLLYREESYLIIGKCMEIHNALGHGFAEVVYKDALQLICMEDKIFYEREKQYKVSFRGKILPHDFFADFVLMNKILFEAKCVKALNDDHVAQVLNYLKVTNLKLGLLVNFGKGRLETKRIVFTRE
jgi:GxxExxY protein